MLNNSSITEEDSNVLPSYKIILLGMSTAGKTKLLTRYIYGSFSEQGHTTHGVDYSIVKQKGAKFGYYDTAGQQKYRSILNLYFKGSDAAIIIYNVADLKSVEEIDYYYQRVQQQVPDCLIYIVGCQNDRDNHIAKDQILNKYKRVKYFSTSAKTNEGVSDFFSTLENDLVKQEKKKKQATHQIINMRNSWDKKPRQCCK